MSDEKRNAEAEFEFVVRDGAGLWGQLRQRGRTAKEAEAVCRRYLEEEEVEPNGSLHPDFTLVEVQR